MAELKAERAARVCPICGMDHNCAQFVHELAAKDAVIAEALALLKRTQNMLPRPISNLHYAHQRFPSSATPPNNPNPPQPKLL